MIICDGFPVGDQHFGENVSFDFCIDFQADPVGSITCNLTDQRIADGQADHKTECLDKFSGLVSGDDIDQVFGNNTASQADNCTKEPERRIKNHGQPIVPCVLINPFCLTDHIF